MGDIVSSDTAAEAASRPRDDIHSTSEALATERRRLRPHGGSDAGGWSALCLSGGGIRSAAFSLGVLQALAAGGMLRGFDYLSTVSGGGFIGGWLQVLIREHGGVAQAEAALGARREAREVTGLRSYTNYLTPEVGAFTADTWTAIALYARNLVLNWLVIMPCLTIVTLGLILHRTTVATFGRSEPGLAALPWIALAIATVVLFAATREACLLLPSHRPAPAPGATTGAVPGTEEKREFAAPDRVKWRIAIPSLGWTLITPIALHGLLPPGAGWGAVAIVPLCYAVAVIAAYLAAWLAQRHDAAATALFRVNAPSWLVATLAATGALVLAECAYLALGPVDQAEALTAFAPLALTLCHLVQAVLHVGLRQERVFADLDREWLARLDGMILLNAIAWTGFALCCLELSAILLPATWNLPFPARATWTVAAMTVLSGPLAAWLGKQAIARVEAGVTDGGPSQWPLRRVLELLATVFAIGLFALLGMVLQTLLGALQIKLGIGQNGAAGMAVYLELLLLQIAFGAALYAISRVFSRVNVNRFSLHGVYRNRLSRAFLGSALRDRGAEPFTGFGPYENPRLAAFAARIDAGDAKLFPVINIALNLTETTHAAWAERKAASFVATPLFCGSAELANPNGGTATGAFVGTADYAGRSSIYDVVNAHAGIRLGTALTISGAAVSPNWGYNSSPITAFLMTLFNVRLGAWLPNPARATPEDLCFASPRNSQLAIFSELLGEATDAREAIYLSDGGHFENLGVYEMLRRQCTRIVVIDAGQDGACEFADLGNAIRKAEIDGLAQITMKPMHILSRTAIATAGNTAEALGIAVGEIAYDGAPPGQLVYLKPSFLPSIPAEIRAYGAAHPEFPHESTAEQWFTESQFESYRALGAWQVDELLRTASPGDLETLFDAAWKIAAGQTVRPRAPQGATVPDAQSAAADARCAAA